MTVKPLDQLDLNKKTVLLRVDYNVPQDEEGRITDDARMRASLPTLEHLLERGCRVRLMSHLGRPKEAYDPRYSLAPVAKHLSGLIGQNVGLLSEPTATPGKGRVQLLENLRFWPGETANDREFAADLARLGEVYVNDAFGAAHRAHASIAAVCEFFEQKGAGKLLMKEIHYLEESLKNPQRPFLAILGGSKVSDKLKLIKNLLNKVDQLMIGGAMSYTFLKAKGVPVGNSRVEDDFLEEARSLISACERKGIDLLLPLDHLTAATFAEDAQALITLDEDIDKDQMGLDIGPETIHLYTSTVLEAKTVVWNGPMGVFEWEPFSTGTISVAEAMAETGALTIVGGGDSVAAIHQAGVEDKITHISTGGGASLELLGGNRLPGIAALES